MRNLCIGWAVLMAFVTYNPAFSAEKEGKRTQDYSKLDLNLGPLDLSISPSLSLNVSNVESIGKRISLALEEEGSYGSKCWIGCTTGAYGPSRLVISVDSDSKINVEEAAISIWKQQIMDGLQYSAGTPSYNTERDFNLGNIDNVQKVNIVTIDADTILMSFGQLDVILNGKFEYSKWAKLETVDGREMDDGDELTYALGAGLKYNDFAVEYITQEKDFDFNGDEVELKVSGIHTNYKISKSMQASVDWTDIENQGLGANMKDEQVLFVFDYKFDGDN